MNDSLRRISVTILLLIVVLLVNATITQVFRADGLRADPRNQRVLLDEYSRQRGQITAGGQLLAYSVSTNGHYRFLRVYPNPYVYAPVTGFYSLRYSSTGLERADDGILNGSDQRLFGRRLADFFTGRDPRGGNVDTTLVPRVQQAAWDAMQQGCGGGPCKGSVVALEPSTGRVLAMVSSPSYDPNQLASHESDEQGNAWKQLRDDPNSPLTNRAISETFPPGSTFKVVTAAAALQAGVPDTATIDTGALNDYHYASAVRSLVASQALIATKLNDAPIPYDQGGPIRIVFPDGTALSSVLDAWNWSLASITTTGSSRPGA